MKYVIGALFGWLVCAATFAIFWSEPWVARDRAEMQRELTAYHHCLLMTSRHRCEMTPQDFVRYYELKHQLDVARPGQEQKP